MSSPVLHSQLEGLLSSFIRASISSLEALGGKSIEVSNVLPLDLGPYTYHSGLESEAPLN